MAVTNLAWGGFRNGQIPRKHLVDIGGGKLLQRDAAENFRDLKAAFSATFPGHSLYVAANQDTYRDLDYQKRMSGTGNHKYKPGGSIHGWARSADVSGYGGTAKNARHIWLQKNVNRFGWSWAYGKELGEPWHFDYIGPVTTERGDGGGSSGTPAPLLQEDDTMFIRTAQHGHYSASPGDVVSIADSNFLKGVEYLGGKVYDVAPDDLAAWLFSASGCPSDQIPAPGYVWSRAAVEIAKAPQALGGSVTKADVDAAADRVIDAAPLFGQAARDAIVKP